MSIIEIKCPKCKCTISVDTETGSILEHKEPEQKKISLGDFVKSQKNRGAELEGLFKKSKDEHIKRKEQLEKDFKRAKEHPEELPGDVDSPFKWD